MNLTRLLSCLLLLLAIATVTVGQARWDAEIQAKSTSFNLGRPMPETPRPVQTASMHEKGWWQAFERGRVYWTSTTGARVVWGDIGERWASLKREQGELEFPATDELPVEGGDPRDRIQRFMGGLIYWRAATRETTVTMNVQAAPNYATTAPATVSVAAPNYATVAPLKYTIPGEAGRKWIDTGLDIRAGAMVYLFAEGEVYYGASVGTHGPAGVTASGVSGFPAEAIFRYGLVARLTSSRTNPEDDLREDYAYGEKKEFCSRSGGRLWLTVNDNTPADNKGEYIVVVKLGECEPDPASQPTPDPGRGTFRVKIAGFRVEHVVHDGLLDAGDDAYLMWDADEFNADGRLISNHRSGQSLVYGDIGRNRAQVQAGTQGDNGGLKAGDQINGRLRANRLPLVVGDFELVAGANAIVFSPTIWIANNETGDNPRLYRQQIQSRVRFLSYDVRERMASNFQYFHWFQSLTRALDDWFEMRFYRAEEDRPIGAARAFYNCPQGTCLLQQPTEILDFVPHTLLLTYKSVNNLFLPVESVPDLLRVNGVRISQREFMYEVRYRDSGPHGEYTILISIERLP